MVCLWCVVIADITVEPSGGLQVSSTSGLSVYPLVSQDVSASEWGVVWLDNLYGLWRLMYGRLGLDSSNSLIVLNTMVTLSSNVSSYTEPAISYGSSFLVLWNYFVGIGYIYSLPVANDGSHSGSGALLDSTGSFSGRPALTKAGSTFGAAWVSENLLYSKSDIIFAPLNSSGSITGSKRNITENETGSSGYPSIAWTGSKFGLCWVNNKSGYNHIYFQRLNSDGSPDSEIIEVTTTNENAFYPQIIWNGSGFALCWIANSNVYFCLLDVDGNTVLDPVKISFSGNANYPRMAWTGAVYGIFWQEGNQENASIHYASVDDFGNFVVSPVSIIAPTPESAEHPDVVWSQRYYLLVWEQGTLASSQIYAGKIIDPDALPEIDDAEIVVMDFPATLILGESYSAQVRIKNTGTTIWSESDGYCLGAVDDSDPFTSIIRIPLPLGSNVEPGEEVSFSINLKAPLTPDTYTTDWRMLKGTDNWFGEIARADVEVRIPKKWYFADGVTGTVNSTDYDEEIAILNPSDENAQVEIKIIADDGNIQKSTITVNAHSRKTFDVSTLVSNKKIATLVKLLEGPRIYAARLLRWSDNGIQHIAGSSSMGLPIRGTRWYFPSGNTSPNAEEYIRLYNPMDSTAEVTLYFYPSVGSPTSQNFSIAPDTFIEVPAKDYVSDPQIACISESTNGVNIVAEREQIYDAGSWDNAVGMSSPGVLYPATELYFAEGSTVGFDEIITVFNPDSESVSFELKIFTTFAPPTSYNYVVPPNASQRIDLGSLVVSPAVAVSIRSTNEKSLVAEREMFWSVDGLANAGAHSSIGSPYKAKSWYLPLAGQIDADDFVAILNPNSTDASININFFGEDGSQHSYTFIVPAERRRTIYVDSLPGCKANNLSAVVESTNDIPIVVECSTYWNSGNYFWIDGASYSGYPVD